MDDLIRRLRARFAAGVASDGDDRAFDELALDVVRYQLTGNEVYRRFAAQRGVEASTIDHWTEAPPVPTRAFKAAPLIVGGPGRAEAVFRTSGTTRGSNGRGEHYVRDLSLYREALLPNFRAHVLPDAPECSLVALVPDPVAVPESSLSYMVGVVDRTLCVSGGGYFFDPATGLDHTGLDRCLDELTESGRAVLLIGTAFSFVHWTDALADAGRRHRLPRGSRVMETGGFKGRSRVVERGRLYDTLHDRLDVPLGSIVNEYGMTELLSQFYETVLSGGGATGSARSGCQSSDECHHVGPAWVRTRVLDPVSLDPLPDGSRGLLHHMDLANVHSVSSVLTEDLGMRVDGGFRVLGRAEDGEPRGCSLMMEDFLSSTESFG